MYALFLLLDACMEEDVYEAVSKLHKKLEEEELIYYE